jgi:chromosome segregation ATPase
MKKRAAPKTSKPATKDDVALAKQELEHKIDAVANDVDQLAIATNNSFNKVEQRLASLEQGQERLEQNQDTFKRTLARVLSIVESIDKKITGIPKRVARLERAVFGRK